VLTPIHQAMIADLKADSERWEAERRAATARVAPVVDYRSSLTHQSRQYYGPTTEATNYANNYHDAGEDHITKWNRCFNAL
jgi:uncharacterized phage-like protein YoqJ